MDRNQEVHMARKRKADHESAITDALSLFWHRGYNGASTRELEEKTGLTRFTLQKTYGGKENFFLATLDAYLDNAEAQHFPDPETCTVDDLARWLEDIASPEKMPLVGDAGCLAFNSISQFDRTDTEINMRVERYLSSLEHRFVEILRRTQARGEVHLPLGPEASGKILIGLLLGLHTVMKARTEDAFPQAYASAAADLVRSWKATG